MLQNHVAFILQSHTCLADFAETQIKLLAFDEAEKTLEKHWKFSIVNLAAPFCAWMNAMLPVEYMSRQIMIFLNLKSYPSANSQVS